MPNPRPKTDAEFKEQVGRVTAKVEKEMNGKAAATNDNEGHPDPRTPEKLKQLVDGIMSATERKDKAVNDIKSYYDQAEDAGYDRRDLKTVIKLKTKSISEDSKRNVNQYCLDLGLPTVYALPH